jgi:uncharacterized tellurite resistance protein B-like protein
MVGEVLGAMKVVQAFNQEAANWKRFTGAVERTFATAKRRMMMRAVMTAMIMADFRRDRDADVARRAGRCRRARSAAARSSPS